MEPAATAPDLGLIVWHDHMSDDVERATAFYGDVLGWDYEIWREGETEYPMISVGGRAQGGFLARGGGSAGWVPYVRVEHLEDAVRRIDAAGGRVHRPPTEIPGVGRFAVASDREGAPFTLWWDGGDRPRPDEAFAWDELYTRDPAGAAEFYRAIFGWKTAPFNDGYTVFAIGETTVAGLMMLPEALPRPGWLPYLTSAEVDRDFARACDGGARALLPPTDVPNVGRVAVLIDPLGAGFGLWRAA